jgi:hypothetical protein
MGRFRKSSNGVPVDIPVAVLDRHPLPSTAKIVDSKYVAPAFKEDNESVEMSAAKIEAEIQNRVNAIIAKREAEARGKPAPAPTPTPTESDDILDQSVEKIEPMLAEMDREALLELKQREEEGKTRKSLLVLIDAALEDLDEA